MLSNFWYVAAASKELDEGPLRRMILGNPVVLYRDENRVVIALADMCSHRRAPLSLGQVVSDRIRCPYHGLEFDRSGTCVHMPGQDIIPKAHQVRSYASAERYGMIWVFGGSGEAAKEVALPDLPWREKPEWNSELVQGYHIDAPAELISENLLDLSHVAFVHVKTIAFPAKLLKVDPLVMEVDGDRIRNVRVFHDVEPPPTHRAWGNFEGLVKRTSASEWTPPGFVSILVRNEDEKTRLDLRFDHFVTPETDSTHRYFVAISRNFAIGDQALTASIDEANNKVHVEDKEIVEAQYRNIVACPESRDNGIHQDQALFRAKRIIKRLEEEEGSCPS